MHEQCPCGTSNCTVWATQLAKTTHTAIIYPESMKKRTARQQGHFKHFSSWEESSQEPTRPSQSFAFRPQLGRKEMRIKRVSAESHWLRSLPHKQKPVPHLTVAATASRDPTKDRPVSVKYSQGSWKLLLLTKNSEFMYSSSQAKHIYQLKVTLIISNVA